MSVQFFSRDEILNVFLIGMVLATLFFFSPLVSISFFSLFVFIMLLLVLRVGVMKLVGYWNGFKVIVELDYFNRYGFKSYERITYYLEKFNKKNSKGILMIIITLMIYILTVGLIIYPNLWRFRIKDIPHRVQGLRRIPETIPFLKTTYYRYSIALFLSLIVYSIVALIISHFPNSKELLFVLFYMAFWTLVPIPVSEGFELFLWNKFLWMLSGLVILLSFFLVFLIKSLALQLFLFVVSSSFVFLWLLWRAKK